MAKLILLTVSFPYGNGEQFLESEIIYLAEKFDEITIIPAIRAGSMRSVPSQVSVDDNFAKGSNIFNILLYSLKTINTYKEIKKYPKILLSSKKLQRLLSFMGRGNAEYHYLKDHYIDDKVLYYSYWFNGSSYALYLLNNIKPIKYILRAHGSDLYLEVNKGYLPFRKEVIGHAYTIFCISKNGVNYMKNTYAALSNTPIKVSRLGTHGSSIDKKKILYPNNQLHLISCAHINPVKRVDMLILALKILGETNPTSQIFWTHIGSGPLYEEIKTMCQQLPNNIVVNLLGHMNNEDILEYYSKNNFELFINTSKSEGIPVTFMEAMSFGIPVMAPSVGGIAEIINEKNGILLPKEINATVVYEKLQKALTDKESLRYKEIEAQKTWEREYNAEKNYKKFAKQLKSIISE